VIFLTAHEFDLLSLGGLQGASHLKVGTPDRFHNVIKIPARAPADPPLPPLVRACVVVTESSAVHSAERNVSGHRSWLRQWSRHVVSVPPCSKSPLLPYSAASANVASNNSPNRFRNLHVLRRAPF
jgi:hypothetical protein